MTELRLAAKALLKPFSAASASSDSEEADGPLLLLDDDIIMDSEARQISDGEHRESEDAEVEDDGIDELDRLRFRS